MNLPDLSGRNTIIPSGMDPDGLDAFHWEPQPKAAAVVDELVANFLKRCPEAAALAKRMHDETATRFIDWIDAAVVPGSPDLSDRLRKAGFTLRPRRGADTCFTHEAATFPDVVLVPEQTMRVAIFVDSCADFCAAHALQPAIEGVPFGPFRRVRAFTGDSAELWVVERHGYDGYRVTDLDPGYALSCVRTHEALRARRRVFAGDEEAFDHAEDVITKAIMDVGRDMACDLFFAAEREYWQRRNRAARVQKERQDALGLGWANHDHHTYRSSRQCFKRLISMLEMLGLQCRERFHPGGEAGWGAQVLEHPVTGVVVFADVDMTSDELKKDFAHLGLQPSKKLGTVGLWCALHGEAFLQAGMHHLECTFDHAALTAQLATAGIGMMTPFSDFPYLRQAFSTGEIWQVRRERVMRLLATEQIDPRQARIFLDEGVIGSHLENLERNHGFKGFNQTGVDQIISATDPRKATSR